MPRLILILSVAFAILWLVGHVVFGVTFPETQP